MWFRRYPCGHTERHTNIHTQTYSSQYFATAAMGKLKIRRKTKRLHFKNIAHRSVFCRRPRQSRERTLTLLDRKNSVTSFRRLVLGTKHPVMSHISSQPCSSLTLQDNQRLQKEMYVTHSDNNNPFNGPLSRTTGRASIRKHSLSLRLCGYYQ